MSIQSPALGRKPRETRQRVANSLREMILEGELLPGAQLMQQNLAQELGASINLVREVLMDLSNLGLVAQQPGIGFSVRELTVDAFMEAAGVRAVLDGLAARLCCQNASRGDIEMLRQLVAGIHDECLRRSFDDRKNAHLMDRELHAAMFEIAGSKTLLRTNKTCWIPMIQVDNPSPSYQQRYEDAYKEHLAILAAIEEDRPDDAERLAREHRRTGMRRVREETQRGSVHLHWY